MINPQRNRTAMNFQVVGDRPGRVPLQAHHDPLNAQNYTRLAVLLCLPPQSQELRNRSRVAFGKDGLHVHNFTRFAYDVELFLRVYIAHRVPSYLPTALCVPQRPLLIDLHEILHTLDINVGEIRDEAAALDQFHGVLQCPPQNTQQGKGHHGGAVDSGGAVDVDLAFGLIESGQGEIDAALEKIGWFLFEIVVRGVKEDL